MERSLDSQLALLQGHRPEALPSLARHKHRSGGLRHPPRDQVDALTVNINTQINTAVNAVEDFSRDYHELLTRVRGTKLLEQK